MTDAAKIHIGPGRLALTPVAGGEAINCGFTKDGAVLKFRQEIEKVQADQLLGPAGFYISGEECEFETLLAELEMRQLNIALGGGGTVTNIEAGPGQPGGDKLEFGEDTAITEYVLTYTAPKRTNRALNVVVQLHIVKVHPDASLTFDKKGQLAYKVRCVARPDTTKPAGKQLGFIFDETAVATGLSNAAQITAFSFAEQTGPATIDSEAGTINIEVANGTDVSALVATFSLSDGASSAIDGTPQVSGETANNFTDPVTYVVTAQDGVSTKNWTVTVSVAES